MQHNNHTRRTVLKTGLATVAAASASSFISPADAAAAYRKEPGETKVVAVMGDYWHPAVSQEHHVRNIFSSNKDWSIYFVVASRYFTPELISDADLVIIARYGGRDSIGWTDEPIVKKRPQGDQIWTDEQVDSLIDNVTNRGMGFMSIHCTLFSGNRRIEDFIGVEPLLHQEIQPCIIKDINQDHPVTQGIKSFYFNLDEQFDAQIKDPDRTTVLFRNLAVHDKRDALGGWCLERGKGRVVGLLPGHYQWTYRVPEYQEIFWRAAYWAMKRDIPPYPKSGGY